MSLTELARDSLDEGMLEQLARATALDPTLPIASVLFVVALLAAVLITKTDSPHDPDVEYQIGFVLISLIPASFFKAVVYVFTLQRHALWMSAVYVGLVALALCVCGVGARPALRIVGSATAIAAVFGFVERLLL